MSTTKTRGPNLVYNCENGGRELSEEDILSLRICERMASLHLTEQEVCDRTGGVITPTMLSKYIHKKSEPGAYKLKKLAQALECSMDYLMMNEDNLPVLGNDNYILWYTGLTREAVTLLRTHKRFNDKRKYESGEQDRPTDTVMLSRIIEEGNNHLLQAILNYTEVSQRCRKIRAQFLPEKPQRMTPDERQHCRVETLRAIRDLSAAENQLMRHFLRAVKVANISDGLLDELEQQEASLRTKVNG